jgi:hypothetical protein
MVLYLRHTHGTAAVAVQALQLHMPESMRLPKHTAVVENGAGIQGGGCLADQQSRQQDAKK